jgi:putative DNA primase/helicase
MTDRLDAEHAFAPLTPDEIAAAASATTADRATDRTLVVPVPLDAPQPSFAHYRLGQPTGVWTYRDAEGEALGHVCRFDLQDGAKEILPYTLWRGRSGLTWEWKSWPAPRPLYGLDKLAERPDATVVIVEGEKCADAAAEVFPRSVVVTSPAGSNAVNKADWTPLAGRHVMIWPDADKPGEKYAREVAAALRTAGAAEIRIVDAARLASRTVTGETREPPDGWDVADALAEGFAPDDLREAAKAASKMVDASPAHVSFDNYQMTDEGLFAEVTRGRGQNAQRDDLWISTPFEVIGRARDPAGHGWAKWLRWKDPDGRKHEFAVTDASLHGDLGVLASDLASRGLVVARSGRTHLADYLNRVTVEKRVTIVPRTGWHLVGGTNVFVLPHETIGAPASETVILAGAMAALYEVKGTLKDWTNGVGRLSAGHSRLVLALSVGFAGPLLGVVNVEGGGVNLFGSSSKGKTTALQAAASIWGRGASDPGFVHSWRATANAQEAKAALVTDTLLALDEIGVADGKDAAAAVYQLTTGVGKGRSARDGSLRSSMTWRVLALSTGEIPMSAKVAEDRGRRAYAGQSVRLLDIPADAGEGLGVFSHAGAEGDAGRLAEAIKKAAVTAYGVAGPAFVRRIVAMDAAELVRLINDTIEAFQAAYVPADADGQVRRAAARLGLIAAAGELARSFGIVPWRDGEAIEAAGEALRDWIALRGGTEPAEVKEIIGQIRRFFEAHGEARFEPLRIDADARPVVNRVGWRSGSGSDQKWFVLPELWRTEICGGLDPKLAAQTLADRGMLNPDLQGKLQRSERTPYGNKRVYVITGAILDGG